MTIKGRFHIDVFEVDVHIIVADDIKRSINYYRRQSDEKPITYEPEGYFYRPKDQIGPYYLFFHPDYICHSNINHEKRHLEEAFLSDRCIFNKGELTAQLSGFLSKKINEFFKKRKIKIY